MDYKIVIDAGHGGIDSGAVGNGIVEKDITLEISKYIYDRLNGLGIPVTMTRTTDETLDPTERVNRILNAYGNDSGVIVISNHINAGGGDGAEVLYALRSSDRLPNLILDNFKKVGQNVRGAKQRRLPSDPSKDYYFIHRNTGLTEPIIIEYGFLDGNGDDINQLKNNYKELAEATVKGILEYIGYEEIDTYIVEKGDTLYSISKRFNIPIDELKRINKLDNDILSIGQILYLIEPVKEYDEYIVVKGDNLYSISKRYNITQKELMDINNLNSNLITIGQILKVPQNDVENTIYTVIPGDTLYSIAKKYNTTVDNIKNKNNLTSNTLSIGQILQI